MESGSILKRPDTSRFNFKYILQCSHTSRLNFVYIIQRLDISSKVIRPIYPKIEEYEFLQMIENF